MSTSSPARPLHRGLALALALALLCTHGLVLLHHHRSETREVPPGYAWSGPACHGHPHRAHLDAESEPAHPCCQCALLVQASEAAPQRGVLAATPRASRSLNRPQAAPALAETRLPSSGRAPPSC